jgi:phosphatidylglycerophosphatase A
MNIKLHKVFSNPSLFLATGFGIGLIPIAPGTYGSILGVVLFLALAHLYLPIFWLSLIILILYFFSYLAVQSALRIIKKPDPGVIVIDEVLGMMLVMMTIPPDLKWSLLAFIMFRMFDILKPWPINQVDSKLKNALGVMLDDCIAAAYAGIVIIVIKIFFI